MKKKGLIISTIVMVIVLVASLTTATYAWFTQSTSTTIDGFDVSVVPGNVLKIGVRATASGYDADAKETDFKTGTVTYANATPGKIYAGTWTGDDGLGSTLEHNVQFGAVSKAVGYDAAATGAETATNGAIITGAMNLANGYIVKATSGNTDSEMANPEAAYANINGDGAGDYAYFDLGVAPTKELESAPKLYIIAETAATYLGIGASIHVAWRVNGGNWTDSEVYGQDTFSTVVAERTAPTLDENIDEAALTAAGLSTTATVGMGIVEIPLTMTNVSATGAVDQVEIIIYVAGADSDCITKAVGNGTYKIGLVFGAKQKTQAAG